MDTAPGIDAPAAGRSLGLATLLTALLAAWALGLPPIGPPRAAALAASAAPSAASASPEASSAYSAAPYRTPAQTAPAPPPTGFAAPLPSGSTDGLDAARRGLEPEAPLDPTRPDQPTAPSRSGQPAERTKRGKPDRTMPRIQRQTSAERPLDKSGRKAEQDRGEQDEPDPLGPEPAPSVIEQAYRARYASAAAASLRQFGYELFSRQTGRTTRLALPGPEYVVGPDDVLKVRFWGSGVDLDLRALVARDGSIDLPRLGQLDVAGQTLADIEARILEEARKYFQGVGVKVTPLELRDIEVYVLGEAVRPGLYVLPPYSTALSALTAAGGVARSGSLRAVQVRRAGKILREIDLYDLLLKGRSDQDKPLRSGDAVFAPRLGPTAAVTGAAACPGIYELKKERALADLLALAGGPLPQAAAQGRLLRFEGGRDFAVRQFAARGPSAGQTPVRDGDLAELDYLDTEQSDSVRLEGHVWTPAALDFRPGLRLAELLASPSQLRPEAVTDFGLIRRLDPATTRRRTLTFPLARLLAGQYDAPLAAGDRVVVLSRQEIGLDEPVTLQGAVWKEGDYQHAPGLTLVDLLALGGGLKPGADAARIELSRRLAPEGESHVLLDLGRDRDFPLRPQDFVHVPQAREAAQVRMAQIDGEVRFPGYYRLAPGERLSDLVRRAGGFTREAYFFGARFTSEKSRDIQQRSIDHLIQDLEVQASRLLSGQAQQAASSEENESLKLAKTAVESLIARLKAVKAEGRVAIKLTNLETFAGSVQDFLLEDGDKLTVPAKPSFVSVVGSVWSPGSSLYQPELTVGDYLARCGGPSATADTGHMYVLRANGEVISAMQDSALFGRFRSTPLMPGDTVVVPEDLERSPWLRMLKDVADIVFKIATTGGIAYAIL